MKKLLLFLVLLLIPKTSSAAYYHIITYPSGIQVVYVWIPGLGWQYYYTTVVTNGY